MFETLVAELVGVGRAELGRRFCVAVASDRRFRDRQTRGVGPIPQQRIGLARCGDRDRQWLRQRAAAPEP